jgi:mitogen-activated protein kinase kinase
MSSSVPLLRPPVPGGRNNSGSPRAPKLTLGIPPSPNAKPVNGTAPALVPQPVPQIDTQSTPQPQRSSGRPAPPRLQLATPMKSQQNLHQSAVMPNGRPAPPPLTMNTSGLGGNGGAPKLSLQTNGTPANYFRNPDGSSDPSSAISSVYSDREGGDRDNNVNLVLPDLSKLSLEKGRPLDVDDLDDEGWHAASEQNMIVDLGSLGEGAGGAVTRCRLKEGKTVFALKVSFSSTIGLFSYVQQLTNIELDHHYGPQS